MNSTNQIEIVNRTCESEIIEVCYWVAENDLGEKDGGVVDWVVKPSIPSGAYGFPSSSGSGGNGVNVNPGSTPELNGNHQWYVKWWWWWLVPPPTIKAFHDPNQILTRSLVLICSDYLVIKCQNGTWWEVVAEFPCDGCDVNLETEKTEHAWCLDMGADFVETYGISNNQSRLATMAAMDCCSEFSFDEICAIEGFLEAAGGLDIDDDQTDLTDCEKALILSYGPCAMAIYFNMKNAIAMTDLLFGVNGDGDCSDAFRHTYFNAINTISCGSVIANMFGIAHECDEGPEEASRTEMDYHNNELGQELGENYNTNTLAGVIADAVCSLLASGGLIVLEDPENGMSNLLDSDGCECL